MRIVFAILVLTFLSVGCKKSYTPKPRGYFRIDLPQKKNRVFNSNCPFVFEFPDYGIMQKSAISSAGPCWYDLSVPQYHAKIYLTYIEIHSDLASHIEDVRSMVYKHIVKADDIKETTIIDNERKVYGIIYDLSGNTATSLSFFLTDSTRNFLSGSLYFSASPNKDSLAPVIDFFREDVVHLTETLTWK